MATLTGKQLKDSYQGLLTIKTADDANPLSGRLENGLGNAITNLGIGIDSNLVYPLTIKEDANNSYIHFINSTTGSLFSDGSQIGVPSGQKDFLINNRESANIKFFTSGDEKLRIEADGDIVFYDDANNQGLFWDASTARLGIGTTSPTEKLQIVDSANDIQVRLGSGNAGINPTLRFHSKNTGNTTNVYADIRVNPDNQTLGFSGTGTSGGSIEQDALVIDSSGNVGIGATSVSSGFRTEIAGGDFRVGDTQGEDAVEIGWSAGGSQGFVQVYDRGDSAFRNLMLNNSLLIDSSGDIQFAGANSNTTVLSLNTTSGSDTKQLSLAGGGADSDGRGARFRLYGNNHASLAGDADLSTGNVSGAQMDIRAKDKITLHTNSNPSVTIDSSGTVLVGKTASGLATTGFQAIKSGQSAFSSDGDRSLILNRKTSDGSILEFRKDESTVGQIGAIAGLLTLGSNNNVALTFTSSAIRPSNNDGSGRDNAIDLGQSGNRFNDLYLGGGAYIGATGTPNGTSIYGSAFIDDTNDANVLKMASSASGPKTLIQFFNPNGTVGSIATNASATAYNTSSDYRLKENVVEMTGALDRVDQLKPSRFNFIADADRTVDGFLAHEVADVVPEAITGEKDATEEYEVTSAVLDDDGNVIEEAVMGTRPVYQGIDQSKLVPLLVGAIQELRAEIEQLKNQ